jgi:drug/metabolite transporter (DMT)-like permease
MQKSFWMLVSSFLFALMAAFTKMGAAHFGTFELVFYRSLMGVALLYLWIRATHRTVRTPFFWGHMLRSFLGTFSLTIWFFAIAYLPLGTSMTLNYTSPLYMALIVAAFALKRGERPDMRAIAAVVAGFAGVTLVLKPELHSGQEIPALVGLSSGFFSALAYFQIRQLTNLREPDWRIVFYFTLFGTVWGGAGQLLLSHGFTPLSAENVPALLGMGLCATGAQLAMTRAWGVGEHPALGRLPICGDHLRRGFRRVLFQRDHWTCERRGHRRHPRFGRLGRLVEPPRQGEGRLRKFRGNQRCGA